MLICCAGHAQIAFEYDCIEKELAPEIEIYEFEFPFETKGADEIKSVGIDCSCTEVETPKAGDKFEAGAKGKLKGKFNPASKSGLYTGRIKIGTGHGGKVLTLKFKVNKLVEPGRLTSFLGSEKDDEIRIKTYYPSTPDNFEIQTPAGIRAEIVKSSEDGRGFSLALKNDGTLEKREKITLVYTWRGRKYEFLIHALPF